jgi:4-hydroxy-4-methyl-2-oxoglutarate aldolase
MKAGINAERRSTLVEEVRSMMPCSASFSEAMGRTGNLDPAIKPVAQGTVMVGLATTVEAGAGDNLALHFGLVEAKPGDVIVADCKARGDYGYWGEFMSSVALAKGVEGIVVDGGVRDIAILRKMPFGVFARGVSVAGTVKKDNGSVNRPIVCGGVKVSPGDLVLGDDDGVVVVPVKDIESIVAKTKERNDDEKASLEQIVKGKLQYSEFMKKKGWMG